MASAKKKYIIRPKPGSEAALAVDGVMVKRATLVTQKARGIAELSKLVSDNPHFSLPEYVVLTDDGLAISGGMELPVFARPCPKLPRHGFKDSVIAKTPEQVRNLWVATKQLDPEAEMVLMRPINADFNCVWTSGQLGIGPGNDGATSGLNAVSFPTTDEPPIHGPYTSVKGAPFFEFVANEHHIYVVQLRDGPKVPRTVDHVATRTTVKEVVRAGGDLLEWESRAVEYAKRPGTVVWHPGGFLASHYAIHSIINDVPIMISREPQVGETLEPTTTERRKRKIDVKGFYRGFYTAARGQFDKRQAGLVMLAGLHNYTAMDLSSRMHAIWWGAACGFAIRMGFLASIGEARYAGLLGPRYSSSTAREEVYVDHWDKFQEMANLVGPAQHLFLNYTGWSGSIGGPKWAACTKTILDLWGVLYRGPSGDLEKDSVQALNIVVNSAHNTGTYLNKFLDDSDFNTAARRPSVTALQAMRTIYALSKPETHTAVPPLRFFKIGVPDTVKLPTEKKAKPSTYTGLVWPNKEVAKPKPTTPFDWTGTVGHAANWPNAIHVQYKTPMLAPGKGYLTHDFPKDSVVVAAVVMATLKPDAWDTSYAGSQKPYAKVTIGSTGMVTMPGPDGTILTIGKLPTPVVDIVDF